MPRLGLSSSWEESPLLQRSGSVRAKAEVVVEMISELPDPQNAWGKAVKLYIPATSYLSICKGLFGPIRAEYTRSELKS
jgi:hypothetical protein